MCFVERFTENLERFEWNRYKHYIDGALYRELVQIISEVEMLLPETELIIGGIKLTAKLVQEVYKCLEADHLLSVIEKYDKIDYPIRNKKTYLRAMLYNEVFEYHATITNDVNTN